MGLSSYLPSTKTDAILTTTLANYRKTLIDNIFNDFVLLWWLLQKGRVRFVDGGASIVEHLLYQESSAGKWYSGYEVLDTTPQEGFTMAEFQWRQCAYSVTISRREERQNSGKEAMINLLKSKVFQAEQSIRTDISEALFASSRADKAINTLAELIDSAGTIGGIARASNSWWEAIETASGSFAAQGITDLRTLYNTVSTSGGKDHPELFMTTQSIYEYYENSLMPQVRYQSMKMADAGFESLRFKGADISYDDNATSGVIYAMNSKYLNFVVDKQTNFVTTPFVRPNNQDARTSQILFMGNMTLNNSRKVGKLTGITA